MALPEFTMRQLLEAGVHYGHQTARWNPRMGEYIYGDRNGIHIIDLTQTVPMLDAALKVVRDTVAKGGRILFVGTSGTTREPVIGMMLNSFIIAITIALGRLRFSSANTDGGSEAPRVSSRRAPSRAANGPTLSASVNTYPEATTTGELSTFGSQRDALTATSYRSAPPIRCSGPAGPGITMSLQVALTWADVSVAPAAVTS